MRSLAVLLLALAYCEARPNPGLVARASLSPDSYILGGVDAERGEFPWQLSQQRFGAAWFHTCGASLLSPRYALTAAHCVDGAAANVFRVVAGLHERSNEADTAISNVQSYKMHESYGAGAGTFPNDIAIISLTATIAGNGGTIQYARLPRDNGDQFVGRSLVISGWGRNNAASNTLPEILQKATIGVLSTAECNQLLSPVNGAIATDTMICLYDTVESAGSCNGDSGGPANINYPDEGSSERVVAGLTSWGISLGDACQPSFPSVYTRTSAYLDWIQANTP